LNSEKYSALEAETDKIITFLGFSSYPGAGESVHWCLHHLRAAWWGSWWSRHPGQCSTPSGAWGYPGEFLADLVGGLPEGGQFLDAPKQL